MPSSRGSSQPKDRTQVSRIAGGFFTVWATREGYTYIKYTDYSPVPLLLWGLKSSKFFLIYLSFHALPLNLWLYVIYLVSHLNLVNYTVFPWIRQYSSHTVPAKSGFDKVRHRWAWEKVREQDFKSGGGESLAQGTGRKHRAWEPTIDLRFQRYNSTPENKQNC